MLSDEPYPFSASDGPEMFPDRRVVLVEGRDLTWYGPSLVTARTALGARLSPLSLTPGELEADFLSIPPGNEIDVRRAAVAELGARLRELADLATSTEADVSVLRETARRLRELAPALRERTRSICDPASVDDLTGGVRMFNPVTGEGNPIAPPMRIESRDRGAEGRCTLGHAHEGPPTYVHGGVSAMLLDQVLGHAAAASGHPGVTADLSVRYRRPVPLGVPLRVWGQVTEAEGRRTVVTGGISTVEEPDVQLVEADGRFVTLRPDQARRLFARSAAVRDPGIAHD